ncbi:MAG TPA: sugar phosphate nucleotidyltransferase [Steroidobacteraceae bacterium]|nr:sugar phosphate nucleotidyltransferase [Steroidobacteraceae bacterium]
MSNRERTWVILLTGAGADPHESQDHRVNNSSDEFAAPLDRQTLFKMTLSRARSIVPRDQIVAVIDRAQKLRWSESLAMLPGGNVIAQPHYRGSAIEVLLAALTMLERDPSARIIAMPTDHYVSNETALASSLLDAATPTAHTRNNLALIGIKPEQPATESGYIVPGRWFEDGTRSVLRIVKPSGKVAASDLIARGALWDSAIVAARAPVLVGLLRACMPNLVDEIETALAQGESADVRQRALARVYTRLPSVDLSYVLALGAAAVCRVITSRSCGWSNLASAQRTIRQPSTGRVAATV